MAYKYKKIKEQGADGYGAAYEVRVDGVLLGTVESREGSRTGFRNGYCIGQVTCTKWYAKTPDGRHPKNPHRPHAYYDGHLSRTAAADALRAATPAPESTHG